MTEKFAVTRSARRATRDVSGGGAAMKAEKRNANRRRRRTVNHLLKDLRDLDEFELPAVKQVTAVDIH